MCFRGHKKPKLIYGRGVNYTAILLQVVVVEMCWQIDPVDPLNTPSIPFYTFVMITIEEVLCHAGLSVKSCNC